MTIIAIRPDDAPAAETTPDLLIPPSDMYAVPENPWKPWVLGTGGMALGSCAATVATILLVSPLIWWALGTTVVSALLFAWVVAGHELHERRTQ